MRPIIDPAAVGDAVLVIRTDYSGGVAWRAVAALLDTQQDDDQGLANHVVDDPAWAGASVEEVLAAAPKSDGVVFVADSATMRDPYPLLAVNTVTREDCEDDEEYDYELEYGREFRVLPAGLIDVSTNLAIGNMDFPEFAAMARNDPSGCYRGLAGSREQEQEQLASTPWAGWSPCDGRLLRRGQTLRDASITSPNGRYALLCSDGRVCLTQDGDGVWLPVGQPSGTGIELSPEGELRYRFAMGELWPLIPDFDHLRGRRKRWPTAGALAPQSARTAWSSEMTATLISLTRTAEPCGRSAQRSTSAFLTKSAPWRSLGLRTRVTSKGFKGGYAEAAEAAISGLYQRTGLATP